MKCAMVLPSSLALTSALLHDDAEVRAEAGGGDEPVGIVHVRRVSVASRSSNASGTTAKFGPQFVV